MKFFRKGTALMLALAMTLGMSESAVLAANAEKTETAGIVEETQEQAVQEQQTETEEVENLQTFVRVDEATKIRKPNSQKRKRRWRQRKRKSRSTVRMMKI